MENTICPWLDGGSKLKPLGIALQEQRPKDFTSELTPEPLCYLKTVACPGPAPLLLNDQAPWGQARRRRKKKNDWCSFSWIKKENHTWWISKLELNTVLRVATGAWIRRVCSPGTSLSEVRNSACCEPHRGSLVSRRAIQQRTCLLWVWRARLCHSSQKNKKVQI